MRLIVSTLVALWLPVSLLASELDQVKKATQYLASDELQGRAAGSEGSAQAAHFIAEGFSDAGLMSWNSGDYIQSFQLVDSTLLDANVVGYVPARVESSRSILVLAHYDGLGIDEAIEEGDHIFNGARDNAVGVAALIALAARFAGRADLRKNVVFIATGAEETGLQGVRHYIEHSLFPIEQVDAVLNIDGFNVSGPRLDYFVMPRHDSELLTQIKGIARAQGWEYESPGWEDSMDTKFDTAPFIEQGIPTATIWTGNKLPNGEPAPVLDLGGIHSVEDEINEHWDWSGITAHLDLYTDVLSALLRESPVSN